MAAVVDSYPVETAVLSGRRSHGAPALSTVLRHIARRIQRRTDAPIAPKAAPRGLLILELHQLVPHSLPDRYETIAKLMMAAGIKGERKTVRETIQQWERARARKKL